MKNIQNWKKFNEEYSKKDIEKDVKRIEDMKTKSRDDEHMLSLSKTMASRITNYEKAHNRALAAEEQNYHDVAEVFFKRAEELKSESKVSEGVAEKSVRTKDKHTELKADKKDSFRKKIKDIIESRKYTWNQVISGFEKKNDENYNVRNNILYDTNVLYPGFGSLPDLLDMFELKKGIIDYMDTSEEEGALIATNVDQIKSKANQRATCQHPFRSFKKHYRRFHQWDNL